MEYTYRKHRSRSSKLAKDLPNADQIPYHHSLEAEHHLVVDCLNKLAESGPTDLHKVLNILRQGWLAPGSHILHQLTSGEISPTEILQAPSGLQRKWFNELTRSEQARWIVDCKPCCTWNQLGKRLALSPRRLQQILQAV